MLDWIAHLSNGWALAAQIEAQEETGQIVIYDGTRQPRHAYNFSLHPEPKKRFYAVRRALISFGDTELRIRYDRRHRSMNEAIKLAYEDVLARIEAQNLAMEKEQAAQEVLEEAKAAGKMFQMADAALQRCLTGENT